VWKEVEDIPLPPLRALFADVYAEMTPQQHEQWQSLEQEHPVVGGEGLEAQYPPNAGRRDRYRSGSSAQQPIWTQV
jgi:hypothetical protein